MAPKVSIILPNYNHARFLERRIDSILYQTFQDFEIIFLDDKSTDNSKEVLSKYSDHPRVSHAIFNEINSTCTFKQWNKGIDIASGEYIWIAESDDYADRHFLEKLVPILEQNDEIGLVYCQSNIVDSQDRLVSSNFLSCTNSLDLHRWTTNYSNNGRNECIDYLAGKNTIPNASAVLIRKSIYQAEVDRQNEIFKVAGDWFTWLKILLKSDIYFCAESLNYFRIHEGSASNSAIKFPIVIQESCLIANLINREILVSARAKKIFFALVSSWWLTYFTIGNIFDWKREFANYQQIVALSPDLTSLLYLHCQILMIPCRRLRFNFKLGTISNFYKDKIKKQLYILFHS